MSYRRRSYQKLKRALHANAPTRAQRQRDTDWSAAIYGETAAQLPKPESWGKPRSSRAA